jgi:hypothetical protein
MTSIGQPDQIEDDLVRMVMGLGTRSVDRLSDDYPVLVSPGNPPCRSTAPSEEVLRYSPENGRHQPETHSFETVEIRPCWRNIKRLSRYPEPGSVMILTGCASPRKTLRERFRSGRYLRWIINRTPFLTLIRDVLDPRRVLVARWISSSLDGKDFYLLQCRSQSYSGQRACASPHIPPIILFTANRFITNGSLDDITHIVYVDPQKYSELGTYEELSSVGRAIGRLNQLLPKRRFILMGPGRWGSRGDIKLGVNATYSDINNTGMWIEIARKHNGYLPEPSFGTHFFQDTVEASIQYLAALSG